MAGETRGFTLLETLVAFTALALILGAAYAALGGGARGVGAAAERLAALAEAENALAEAVAAVSAGRAPAGTAGVAITVDRWPEGDGLALLTARAADGVTLTTLVPAPEGRR